MSITKIPNYLKYEILIILLLQYIVQDFQDVCILNQEERDCQWSGIYSIIQ